MSRNKFVADLEISFLRFSFSPSPFIFVLQVVRSSASPVNIPGLDQYCLSIVYMSVIC